VHLDLSFNNISQLNSLSGLKELKDLKLDGNCVAVLDPLQHCTSLRLLSVRKNKITSIEAFLPLAELASLKTLVASDNPCMKEGSRAFLQKNMKHLRRVDGKNLALSERSEWQPPEIEALPEFFSKNLPTARVWRASLLASEELQKMNNERGGVDQLFNSSPHVMLCQQKLRDASLLLSRSSQWVDG